MIYIVYFAVLLCMLAMFFVKRTYKAAIILLSELVFLIVKVPYLPYGMANYLIPICFLLSEITHLRKLISQIRKTIVWSLLGIYILSIIITIIFSPHLHELGILRTFLRMNVWFKYLLIAYSFWCYSDEKSLKPTLKASFFAILFITLFGVINLITKESFWISALLNTKELVGGRTGIELSSFFMYEDRFRNQSIFMYAFDYGFCCLSMLLFYIYAYSKGLINKKIFVIVFLCCLFGIISCGCRTIVLCSLFGVGYMLITAYNKRKSIAILCATLSFLFLAYEFVPFVRNRIDESGSTIEGRLLQFKTVLYYIDNNFLLGNGVYYYAIDLNGNAARNERVDKDLQGLESVAFSYLLERGVLGLFLYFLFWIVGYIYLWKNRRLDKLLSSFGCSLILIYLLFSNMTGELNSLYFILPLLGCVYKLFVVKRKSI